jgi:uncharacterized protein (TIGR00661 family)
MLKILVAPLDWGLGHATRCIPIIRELDAKGCKITIAASGATATLLQKEFPGLPFLSLRGYKMKYGKRALLFSVFLQIPKILRTIRYEKRWLATLLMHERFDLIISDNRPGLNHKSVPTVYMTHQLQILSGMGKWADSLLFKIHRHFFKKFNEVWVPDFAIGPGLAGRLSHPSRTITNVKYIGPLSRLSKNTRIEPKWEMMFLLSGPEPGRSAFEKILMSQLSSVKAPVLLVRGLPDEFDSITSVSANVVIKNHLSSEGMADEMNAASLIICRSGYTTVMDLVCLSKKAVLIPTPGQTEQEYLARHLKSIGYFPCLTQSEFSIEKARAETQSIKHEMNIQGIDFMKFKEQIHQCVQILLNSKKN